MCLACSFPQVSGDWTAAGLSAAEASSWSRHDAVLDALNAIVSGVGVVVRRPHRQAGYVVTVASGRAARAATVDDIWCAVETLTGRTVDPLAPPFRDRAD